ncbi:PIG-L family deacetylase [uncultured Methanobacterium sp.]|uniref:PIG-L deacetylase family protein n=1 Tax=uncultured Methanobacterium sp. TaxID=176306 RepID=UPI002AA73100|nr:PIG-L family deacetylase [uncultured Methanobacterium sp.]
MTTNSPQSSPQSNRKKLFLIVLGLIMIISVTCLFLTYFNTPGYAQMPEIHSNDRILVFAPHPDDESLAAGGLIKRARDLNATVMVVVMTDGSSAATPDELSQYLEKNNKSNSTGIAELRYQETTSALSKLGVNNSNIIFLGYPDTGLRSLFEDYWDPDKPYQSNTPFNHFDHSPYNFTYQPNATYTGSNVAENLKQIMTDFKPTIIIAPDGLDEHHDHWATNAFVMYSAAATNFKGTMYTYMVHKGGTKWPSPPNYQPSLNLTPPQELQNQNIKWIETPLTSDEEKAKEEAVNSYGLPLSLTKGYLKSFIRTNELFIIPQTVNAQIISATNFTKTGMPSSSFEDVRYDYNTKTLKTSDEMSSVGVTRDNENCYIVINSTHQINGELIYQYHFRLLENGQFKRLDVKVQNGTAVYEKKSVNSLQPENNATVEVQGNMLVLKLPLNIFKNVSFLMMNTDVNDKNGQLMDLSSWRELKVT